MQRIVLFNSRGLACAVRRAQRGNENSQFSAHRLQSAAANVSQQRPIFTVDTHLFRELGELLVGRDSTALVELVKNCYDADATAVKVWAENLDDPERGRIVVQDDGLGMTRAQFENGFLRIASRNKEGGSRRSPRLSRRYTGEKGIGRLAAHKLARRLEVQSVASDPTTGKPIERVHAVIDWDKIEQGETLDRVPDGAVSVESKKFPARNRSKPRLGTTITLTRLRRKWTQNELLRFVSEAQSTRPPECMVVPLPSSVLAEPLLFNAPRIHSAFKSPSLPRHRAGKSPGKSPGGAWSLVLDGEFNVGEEYWHTLAENASWVLEIDATDDKEVRYGVAPTVSYAKANPDAARKVHRHTLPEPVLHPRFQARILIRQGAPSGSHVAWIRRQYGIRVYMEEFRVLPYGEPGDDWLELDKEHVERGRGITKLASELFADSGDNDEGGDDGGATEVGFVTLPNRQYLGAIFLTQDDAGSLKMLVNREGFVPDRAFYALKEVIRNGIAVSVRERSAATRPQRDERRQRRANQKLAASDEKALSTPLAAVEHSVRESTRLLREVRERVSTPIGIDSESDRGDNTIDSEAVSAPPRQQVEQNQQYISAQTRAARDEQSMIRVLASIGTQMAGFVHELNGMLGLVRRIENMVERLRTKWREEDPGKSRQLAKVASSLADLRRFLERQGAYLTEIVTPDARRRRSRQRLADCFDKACDLVAHEADAHGIHIRNKIPSELKSPPMFRAEAVAVFSNLITNAIKAAGSRGRIQASGNKSAAGGATVRIQNTGVAVDESDGERWFRPFESTTSQVDATLGQGMGLGLPITRSLLEERGATISFVKPTGQYATAVKIEFPK